MSQGPKKSSGRGDPAGLGSGRGQRRQVVKTARRRSAHSTRWLQRQLDDPYVAAAQREGWRSRAAFKLQQLDEKCRLLKPGQRVVDLGAAPGGWSQVVARSVITKAGAGSLVAIDILPMDPLPDATVLQGDFTDPEAPALIKAAMRGPADLVLSDLSPNTTGHAATDHLRILYLVELAAAFAEEVLEPGGAFVAKVFHGGADNDLLSHLKRRFATIKHIKPAASRQESAEIYLVAQGFRGNSGD